MNITQKQVEHLICKYLPQERKYNEEQNIELKEFQQRLFRLQAASQQMVKLINSFANATKEAQEIGDEAGMMHATAMYLPKELSKIIFELLSRATISTD